MFSNRPLWLPFHSVMFCMREGEGERERFKEEYKYHHNLLKPTSFFFDTISCTEYKANGHHHYTRIRDRLSMANRAIKPTSSAPSSSITVDLAVTSKTVGPTPSLWAIGSIDHNNNIIMVLYYTILASCILHMLLAKIYTIKSTGSFS